MISPKQVVYRLSALFLCCIIDIDDIILLLTSPCGIFLLLKIIREKFYPYDCRNDSKAALIMRLIALFCMIVVVI